MTVENTVSKTGKQVMGALTYDFSFYTLLKDPTEEAAKKAIKCAITDGSTETILTYGKDYSVTLNNNRNGGRVTVVDPKNASWTITIYRSYEATQGADYNDFDALPAETLEQCLDKQTMLVQQLQEEVNRCPKVNVTGNQTPEELLAEIYGKLDSATEIAGKAISAADTATVAANNASTAVKSAEKTLAEVTSYVDTAKGEINTTVENAKSNINTTASAAVKTVEDTKTTAIDTINTAVASAEKRIDKDITDAENSINQTIAQAVDDVKKQAVDAAQAAIDSAAEEATNTAKANLNSYVNETVEPSLQHYVDEAQTAQSAAATSAVSANNSAAAAGNYAAAALASEQNSLTNANATKAALEEALELTGHQIIFGGRPNDGVDDVLIGGVLS
ncbi:MAG TPA: hypothetical protein DD619_04750 [Alphaproteobacteria bacterium]|nr:hypothetical protein [Alphaproteobacteria bacterium]